MIESWKTEIITESQLQFDTNGILAVEYAANKGTEFHESKPKGANLRELSAQSMNQISWETPSYLKVLDEFLQGMDLKESVALDLGCGDGRFVDYLLEQGCEKIVAIESHYTPLKSLSDHLKRSGQESKVLLINCSAEQLPIKNSSIDIFLAINVLYYLNDKRKMAVKEMARSLNTSGKAIATYHNREAILLRSLLFNGVADFLKVVEEGTFKETNKETSHRFEIRSQKEEEEEFKREGFTIESKLGVSLLHQFLHLHLLSHPEEQGLVEDNLKKVLSLFAELDTYSDIHKTKLLKLKKN